MVVVKEISPESPAQEVDEIEDEDDNDDEEVYEVERVVGHKHGPSDGNPKVHVLKYLLQWKGYSEEDNTWEEEESCSCHALIAAYWDRYEANGGKRSDKQGRDKAKEKVGIAKKGVLVGKPSSASSSAVAAAAKRSPTKATTKAATTSNHSSNADNNKRTSSSKSAPLLPDLDSLDDNDEDGEEEEELQTKASSPHKKKNRDGDVEMTTTPAKRQKVAKSQEIVEEEVEEEEVKEEEEKESRKTRWSPPEEWTTWEEKIDQIHNIERNNAVMKVHIGWKNGKETVHLIHEAHKKCPQQLIRFYESHLKFIQATEDNS